MSKLTFRNSHGQLVDISAVAATKVKNEFGTILEHTLRHGAVAITRHDNPKAVLLSLDEFESLIKQRSRSLDQLNGEFDALLVRMQTPSSRKAVETAFTASPEQLGRIAAKTARTRRTATSSPAQRKSTSRA